MPYAMRLNLTPYALRLSFAMRHALCTFQPPALRHSLLPVLWCALCSMRYAPCVLAFPAPYAVHLTPYAWGPCPPCTLRLKFTLRHAPCPMRYAPMS